MGVIPPKWAMFEKESLCPCFPMTTLATSPKSKSECWQFAEFFGLFLFLGRFALNSFKKCICPVNLKLIGLFSPKTKLTLRFDQCFVIWSKESGQFHPKIISQKYSLAFLNRIEQVHSPQNGEKSTQVLSKLSMRKGKLSKRVSPPNGNRPGVFKRGDLRAQSDSLHREDHRMVFTNWLTLLFCLVVW